jgi:3-hydroxymyristoyl/3-hydroxydecanoyl-(acyl carrier protein) dehydratase
MADRAQPEANHRFSLLGRTDRIVKLEEKRISLDAIEQALQASPFVIQARIIALQAPRMRLAAFVVLSEGGRALLAAGGKLACNRALRDVLEQSVEAVAVPRRWRYLDALPVNAQGKTTQADLLALLETMRPLMPRERLLEQQALHAVFELTAPESLFYFDGHFAGAPILPGVVQLDWVIAYGRRCFDLPPVFLGVHALKFQQVIRPEMPITLDLVYDLAKSSLNFRISSSGGQHASGRVLFGSVDNA